MDAIHLPNGITLPTAFGAPGAALQAGQVIEALVLELLENGTFRLEIPQAIVDVRSDVPLTPGSTVTLAVKGSGPNARLGIYSDSVPPRAPALPRPASLAPPAAAVPNLAGRRLLGEAVIVARAPPHARPSVAPTPRAAVDPAVATSDAPSISPARPVLKPDAPQLPVTPERALGEAVRAAATRQTSLAPLFADLERAAANPALPTPVRAAAAQVLSLRVPLDEALTGQDVKQAFLRSAVLFEPRLAAVQEAAEPAVTLGDPRPASDIKAALLVLRQILKAWAPPLPENAPPIAPSLNALSDVKLAPDVARRLLGLAPLAPEQAKTLAQTLASALLARDPQASPSSAPNGPPPPYRGAPLSAQPLAAATITPETAAREIAERLIVDTEGAIARTTLMQAASLPDQATAQPHADTAQRWTFEIPFAVPQGTAVAQFEVSRDARGRHMEEHERAWRARFSLDMEPMGPVHAIVTLTGTRAGVALWAERAATIARLNESAAQLSEQLRAAELEPADFLVRAGAPPVAAKQALPGRFMDRAT